MKFVIFFLLAGAVAEGQVASATLSGIGHGPVRLCRSRRRSDARTTRHRVLAQQPNRRSSGTYVFDQIPPGAYTLTVAARVFSRTGRK